MPSQPVARPRWRWLPLVAVLALVGGWGTAGPSQAQLTGLDEQASTADVAADPGTEAQFVSRINSLRASKGLSQLQVHAELTGVARRWTDRMVANGGISHNPNLGSQVSGNWSKLGENVGVGHDVDELMRAFINSPAHYANLVDPDWNYIGVGVTFSSDGRLYTTHNFMELHSSSGGTAPPPPPPSRPRQPTATTAPPATTPPPPPTTTTTAPPPPPEPTETRATAVLEPLRSLESR